MRKELLNERYILRCEVRKLTVAFMEETDKEKGLEMLSAMKKLAKRIEEINYKLAHKDFMDSFKRG